VLASSYPEPMTAREVAEVLAARGYGWPLRPGYDPHAGVWRGRDETGEPTPERVRRVCEIKGNRTDISFEGRRGVANTYSIYRWAMEAREKRTSCARLSENKPTKGEQ
jgi:hypothetical protein